ncbi:MAG: hypothetical protein HGA95_01665, partial [Caldiserica bacterium]|nr:hypothetical protein [Caldisericota bacterium]
MKTVTLWGYYGYGNVGDEAILASMLNLLEGVKVNLISGPVPSVEESDKLKIIPRSIKRLISSISKSNGFVLGGGGLVHDRINAKSTWYHLLGPSFSRFSNKPVAAIGQQIGPFYRNFTKKLVYYSLSKATLTVRDQKSFNEAKSLGLDPILSADMAFLLKPDEPSLEIAEKIKNTIGNVPLILKIAYFKNNDQFSNFLKELGGTADAFAMINTIAGKIV